MRNACTLGDYAFQSTNSAAFILVPFVGGGVKLGRKIIPKFKTSRLVWIYLVVFSVIKSHK